MKVTRSILAGTALIALGIFGHTASAGATLRTDDHAIKSSPTHPVLMARGGSDNSGRGSDHGGGDRSGRGGDDGGRGDDGGNHQGRGTDDPAGDDHGGRGENQRGRGADDAPGDDHGVHDGVHHQNDNHEINHRNDDHEIHHRRKADDRRVMITIETRAVAVA